MISVEEARNRVLEGVFELPTETIRVEDGLGRVLAKDVRSNLTQPPKDVSAMDGYAVRMSDIKSLPQSLDVIGESSAGSGFSGTMEPGGAVRIFTGAPIPEGADTIIIQENTERDGNTVVIRKPGEKGKYIRPAGLDFREGELMLAERTRLAPRDLALAASTNNARIDVYRRPKVAILSNGNELVPPGETPGPDQIISSNNLLLSAFVTANGGIPMDLGIARDTEESLREHLSRAGDADMLITIGGASVGDYDLVGKVLADEGLDLNFYKVAMRPGKPLIFGHLKDMPILGLPGNPVSAGVTAALFVRPAMQKMMGVEPLLLLNPYGWATLGTDLPGNDSRQDYLRAGLTIDKQGRYYARPFPKQDSSMLAVFTNADCLVMRPPHAPPAKEGDSVQILHMPYFPIMI